MNTSNKILLITLVLIFLIAISSTSLAAPQKPTVSFTGTPTSGYEPLSVQFTSKTTGNPNSYYWVFEPPTSSDWNSHHAGTAVHTFNNPGVYTVSLSVSNSAGGTTATKKNYITVWAEEQTEKPTATFDADVRYGKAPLKVQFGSSTTGNPTSYFWIFEPSTSNDWNSHHAVTAVHTFKKPGVYTISLVVSNSAGSTTVTKNSYIHVY